MTGGHQERRPSPSTQEKVSCWWVQYLFGVSGFGPELESGPSSSRLVIRLL